MDYIHSNVNVWEKQSQWIISHFTGRQYNNRVCFHLQTDKCQPLYDAVISTVKLKVHIEWKCHFQKKMQKAIHYFRWKIQVDFLDGGKDFIKKNKLYFSDMTNCGSALRST